MYFPRSEKKLPFARKSGTALFSNLARHSLFSLGSSGEKFFAPKIGRLMLLWYVTPSLSPLGDDLTCSLRPLIARHFRISTELDKFRYEGQGHKASEREHWRRAICEHSHTVERGRKRKSCQLFGFEPVALASFPPSFFRLTWHFIHIERAFSTSHKSLFFTESTNKRRSN